MTVDEINPFVRYAKVHTAHVAKKESSVGYDARFFYVSEGEGTLTADGQSYKITPHTAICIFPAIPYRFSFKNPTSVNICVLNFDMTAAYSHICDSLGTATEDTIYRGRVHVTDVPEGFSRVTVRADAVALREHITACVELFLKKDVYYRPTASAHLKLALLTLLEEHRGESGDYRLSREVGAFVREHFADATLDNRAVAAHFGYHPYHLSRLVKRHTGQPLHEYLMDYRLHMARELLATTSLRVTDIAERVGFASYAYFIRLFRERTGLSPLKYRAAHRATEF